MWFMDRSTSVARLSILLAKRSSRETEGAATACGAAPELRSGFMRISSSTWGRGWGQVWKVQV